MGSQNSCSIQSLSYNIPNKTKQDVRYHNPLIIVGLGSIGVDVAKKLIELGIQTKVLMFRSETWDPRETEKSLDQLTEELPEDEIFRKLDETESLRIHQYTRIVSIDRDDKSVIDSFGKIWFYSNLVLVIGSNLNIVVSGQKDIPVSVNLLRSFVDNIISKD